MQNMQLVRDNCQFQIVAVDICLIIFSAHMNIFIIKVKILELIKWSYRWPQLCWLFSLEWLLKFWARSPISCKHMKPILVSVLRFIPNHRPFKYSCPINKDDCVHTLGKVGIGTLLYIQLWGFVVLRPPWAWVVWYGRIVSHTYSMCTCQQMSRKRRMWHS